MKGLSEENEGKESGMDEENLDGKTMLTLIQRLRSSEAKCLVLLVSGLVYFRMKVLVSIAMTSDMFVGHELCAREDTKTQKQKRARENGDW